MQGIDADPNNLEPRVTVDADGPSGVQRAADAASAVSRALAAAGYTPRHLSVTSSESGELGVVARLDQHARAVDEHTTAVDGYARTEVVAIPARAQSTSSPVLARLAIGVTLGVLLGFLGLPRLELPAVNAPAARPTVAPPQIISVQDLGSNNQPAPTPEVPTPLPTVAPQLFDSPLTTPIPGWPNDPQGTAWFGVGGYRLMARDAGRFVATAVPLAQPVQDVSVSATFHKLGGPPGGGYGLIVRDQGRAADRDGRNQAGKYLVFEVADRGDVGIWQRDDTRWVDVLPWQHSDAVHTDAVPNSIVVTTRGANVLFEVNGQTVADLNYDKLPNSGGVGIFTGGDLNEVALERLRIANAR